MVKTMNNKDLLKLILTLSNNDENNFEEKHQLSINNFLLNEYVIVRTYSAGVFAGILQRKIGNEVILTDARRIWYWDGAASLSQLAEEGTKKPENCKFPQAVKEILLVGVIEILKVSKKAEESIKGVEVWKK